ncbi:hypothetical protein ACFOW1_03230 [Parasediminibacterium paludis]|uniref:Uncharacterized protein n=1 Tax=Parasediminibacterium paludis TaxID=908966 RepID=A0ABV8PRY3_9BACT
MSLTTRLFKVSGSKIQSLYIADSGLHFSSNKFDAEEDFEQSWGKTLTLATKIEIPFDKIKSVTKEDAAKELSIKYKAVLGIGSDCEFSFVDNSNVEVLFNHLQAEHYFTRSEAQLSPFGAIWKHLLGLALVAGVTVFSYNEALAMANGAAYEPSTGRARLFMRLIELLGDKGVLVVGIAIAGYIGYKLVTRFKNPPIQIKLLPPMG